MTQARSNKCLICVSLLRPAVTHQLSGRALGGKYEATGRLSGRPAASGISLSLSHTHIYTHTLSHRDCSFHARA